jgi:threonyl-tRNA synthetase
MSQIEEKNEQLEKLRHSTAHIMAQAVVLLYPGTKLAIGPTIKDGFYYDMEIPTKITEEDFPKIEAKMDEIIEGKQNFEQSYLSRDEALSFFKKIGQDFKCEIISDLPETEKISIYKNESFIDLCRGPHIENTKEVRAFKLMSIAGAYWRGDEKRPMLTRIYGTAFLDRKELKAYLTRIEEAKKRDHRKLGKDLDLFSFHDEAPAMVFFHGKGFFIFNKLIDTMRQQLLRKGYDEVEAPSVLSDDLWKKSGHYANFKENMYFTCADNREYAVKPMNCPGHALIYKTGQRSYRDLPLRLAEFGKVHRFERSGVTHGLMRVRAFTQDDAHHFCTEDQLQQEIEDLIEFTKTVYEMFGFENYSIAVSTRPELSMGDDAVWEKATASLEKSLKNLNLPYKINEGEGAFYGPKIEFVIYDSLERPWQCGTIQVDFSMPERFELEYIASDGTRKRPVMIHRAIYGSIERFMGILIEHFGGAFPAWLSPLQVKVISISEKQEGVAEEVVQKLLNAGFRAEKDIRPEKIGYKIREAETQKIPYALVIGEREAESGEVAVRGRGRKDLGVMKLEQFIKNLTDEVNSLGKQVIPVGSSS